MSLPTTQWGNTGVISGTTADIYSTLPGPTSSTPGSADGPVLGNYQILADGSAIQFLKFTATTTQYKACQVGAAWQNAYDVTPTTAANQACIAVNDLAGSTTITANYYTWGKVKGLAFPLVAASVAAGAVVAPSATSGTLYAATAGTDLQSNIVNTIVVGASAASSPCLIF